MVQSICVTCKVRPGRLRPMGTEVHRPRLWAEGSAVPGSQQAPRGLSSAFQGEERKEPGEDDGRGRSTARTPRAAWHPQASLELEGPWPCCPSSAAGPAAGCMNAVVPARGADQSLPRPIGNCKNSPAARATRQFTPLYSSAWKEIKLPVHAPRGLCVCAAGAQGSRQRLEACGSWQGPRRAGPGGRWVWAEPWLGSGKGGIATWP